MIGLTLEDTVVLRRTLEELEAKTRILSEPLRSVAILESGSTLEETILRLNQTLEVVNTIINALNKSSRVN